MMIPFPSREHRNFGLVSVPFGERTQSGGAGGAGGRVGCPVFVNTERKQTRPGSRANANTFVEE